MDTEKHVGVDDLAAYMFGALDDEAGRSIVAHLATGCARCTAEYAWLERTIALSRADTSVDAPEHVVARAVRIFDVERLGSPARVSMWRRLRALPIFDSLDASSPALAMGARGTGAAVRQVLYGVAAAGIEIDLQVQRHSAGGDLVAVRGQVFSTDDDPHCVAGLAVEIAEAGDAALPTTTSPLGEFALEAPEDADLLVLRLHDCEIEIPLPRP